jgi:hypothetical protein
MKNGLHDCYYHYQYIRQQMDYGEDLSTNGMTIFGVALKKLC